MEELNREETEEREQHAGTEMGTCRFCGQRRLVRFAKGMTQEELDYSFLFAAEPKFSMQGRCMYCNHCLPCAKHINIAQLSKYLDMALLDGVTPTLQGHYDALEHHAGECIACGRCETQCPFGVPIMQRMKKAEELFGK